jgi:hypothetical protein
MKTKDHSAPEGSGKMRWVSVRPIVVGFWAVTVMVFLSGCVADKSAGYVRSTARPLAEPLRLDLGRIAVVAAPHPAVFSFDKARGQIEDAGDGAGDAAGRAVVPPNLGVPLVEPLFEAAASPVALALAPFAAARGAVTAHQRLGPDSLSQSESNLLRAMTEMAGQKYFRNALLDQATGKTRRQFVPVESESSTAVDVSGTDAVLKTEVQELRLERTGKGDNSFALCIKTRNRLVRVADGAVLFDELAQYRSGTCLFLDWTRGNSLQLVAETAYRKLAEQVVEQLFVATADGPILVGAGHKKAPLHEGQTGPMLAKNKSARAVPVALFINSRAGVADSVDIYSSGALRDVILQRPLTRDQAVGKAIDDVTWGLDGLHQHPNVVVLLTACAVAIPLSVFGQTEAIIRGLSPAKLKEADAKMTAAVRETKHHEEIAAVVAQQLAPHLAGPVMLVERPAPTRRNGLAGMVTNARRVPVSLAGFRPVANDSRGRGADVALDIHVVNAALKGDDGINSPLALCIEAEARWIRTSDGQEVYSCPVSYRSEKHKYTEWAAHDAQLFREELQRSYREVGTAMGDHLVSRQIIVPERAPPPTLAGN